jgi:hypothetical protein
MRKAGWLNLTVALGLLLLAVIVLLPLGAGPGALDSEISFITTIRNSLGQLDAAKSQWAEEKHKPERDVPTVKELAPYLGQWTNSIKRLVALGVEYTITPISKMEPQSDTATLTRNICFRRGYCRFYPAGTRYGPQGSFHAPRLSGASWFLDFYHNNRGLLAAALFTSGIGSLLVFAVMKIRSSRQVSSVTHEHQHA